MVEDYNVYDANGGTNEDDLYYEGSNEYSFIADYRLKSGHERVSNENFYQIRSCAKFPPRASRH